MASHTIRTRKLDHGLKRIRVLGAKHFEAKRQNLLQPLDRFVSTASEYAAYSQIMHCDERGGIFRAELAAAE